MLGFKWSREVRKDCPDNAGVISSRLSFPDAWTGFFQGKVADDFDIVYLSNSQQ
jgi:hypothetical protein